MSNNNIVTNLNRFLPKKRSQSQTQKTVNHIPDDTKILNSAKKRKIQDLKKEKPDSEQTKENDQGTATTTIVADKKVLVEKATSRKINTSFAGVFRQNVNNDESEILGNQVASETANDNVDQPMNPADWLSSLIGGNLTTKIDKTHTAGDVELDVTDTSNKDINSESTKIPSESDDLLKSKKSGKSRLVLKSFGPSIAHLDNLDAPILPPFMRTESYKEAYLNWQSRKAWNNSDIVSKWRNAIRNNRNLESSNRGGRNT